MTESISVSDTQPAKSPVLKTSRPLEHTASGAKQLPVSVSWEMSPSSLKSKESLPPKPSNSTITGILPRTSFSVRTNEGRRKSVAGKRGTTVKIRKLLDTLPVRLAKMKKHPIPHAKIKSLTIAYALVNNIRFCFLVRGNRRTEWSLANTCGAMGVAISAFGKEMDPYTLRKWTSERMTVESILPNRDEGTSNLGPLLIEIPLLPPNKYIRITFTSIIAPSLYPEAQQKSSSNSSKNTTPNPKISPLPSSTSISSATQERSPMTATSTRRNRKSFLRTNNSSFESFKSFWMRCSTFDLQARHLANSSLPRRLRDYHPLRRRFREMSMPIPWGRGVTLILLRLV
jgi:hypothetical protein